MKRFRGLCCVLAALGTALAQAPTGPVIDPRGVVNSFTLDPAPSSVAPGGLFTISGYNLASDSVQAPGVPWPVALAGTRVMVNGRPASLYSVSLGTIVAQVPWELQPGPASVVVQSGGVASKPAWLTIAAVLPSIRSNGDNGFGPVKSKLSGNSLVISASGLGRTNPPSVNGAAAPADTTVNPVNPITAYVGGLPAAVTTTLATDRVGEFDIAITLPAGAQAGDLIQLYAGRTAGNGVTYGALAAKDAVQFLAIPDGTPVLASLVAADLKGNYLVGNAARDDSGCWTSFVIDVGKQSFSSAGCLTTAARNAPSPVVAATDASVLAAMVGPPTGDATTGVSSQLMVFDPTKTSPTNVALSAPAVSLTANPTGDFNAVLAATPRQTVTVDAQTGQVAPVTAGPGAGAGAGGTGGAGAGGGGALTIDLGAGLTHTLTPAISVGVGSSVLVVGDDANKPAAAKLAIINQRGDVTSTQDFPSGWLPLVAPPVAVQTGPGGAPGGGAGGGAGGVLAAAANAVRVRTYYDTTKRVYYVLAVSSDGAQNGFLAFTFDQSSPVALPFPNGWFATACTTPIPFSSFDLSRQIAVAAAQAQQTATAAPCPANGFVELALDGQTIAAVAMPGQDQFNAAAGGALGTINNYVYATNANPSTDRAKSKAADSLFVMDGVNASAFRLDLPTGVQSFAALTQIDALNSLVADATTRTPGDAGIILFDLYQQAARLFPTPEGYAAVTLLGVFPTTRKLAALGTRTGVTGSNLLVFDLITSDLVVVPNPPGVAFVGTHPAVRAAAGAPPQTFPTILLPDPKTNTVQAIGYDTNGTQVGVIVLRVP